MRYFKNISVYFLLLSLLQGSPFAVESVEKSVPEVPEPEPKVVEAEATELEMWIDKLETYELDQRFPRDYCRLDTNGKYSCGCLQYQLSSFLADNKKYQLFENPKKVYKKCSAQKKLAEITLLNEPNGWTRWHTSVKRGLGKPPVQ